MREQQFGSTNLVDVLAELRGRPLNYDPAAAPLDGRPDGHWHVDSGDTAIGHEHPGPPSLDGAWARACTVVRDYEFTEPAIIRGVYHGDDALLGRNILLESRFAGLRFYLGVRVTEVIDESRGDERVWGWSYQTLAGHLEQGRLTYEVIKNETTGDVLFRVSGYSRQAPISNPVVRWGFRVFGRRMQQRFYLAVGRRMQQLVASPQAPVPTPSASGVVVVPSGAELSSAVRLLRATRHPGS